MAEKNKVLSRYEKKGDKATRREQKEYLITKPRGKKDEANCALCIVTIA